MHDSLKLHMEATAHLQELVEEIQALLRAGKVREAKRVQSEATKLREHIEALEHEFRPRDPAVEP